MRPTLHLVALDVPWPADYGGVQDIYYQIKHLHDLGVAIILHVWQYGRPRAPELESLCLEVHYYRRAEGLGANLSLLPYNVYGRRSSRLVDRLASDDHPILYEGLHTTYPLTDPRLRGRRQFVRYCNVEHRYYHAIARAEHTLLRRAFHHIEALRFGLYERRLRSASMVIAVSTTEVDYLRTHYPEVPIACVPCLHPYSQVSSSLGTSDYMLYHGKLSVTENVASVLYLAREVWSQLPYRVVVAGMNPPPHLYEALRPYPHIELIANPDEATMHQLITEAQLHILYTAQATGLKLKLLASLFAGRHVLANSTMVAGSTLGTLCHLADSPEALVAQCHTLMARPFDAHALALRQQHLAPYASPHLARALMRLIWPHL